MVEELTKKSKKEMKKENAMTVCNTSNDSAGSQPTNN